MEGGTGRVAVPLLFSQERYCHAAAGGSTHRCSMPPPPTLLVCSEPYCTRPALVKGRRLCRTHYRQRIRIDRTLEGQLCTFRAREGLDCGRPVYSRGLCERHYCAVRRHSLSNRAKGVQERGSGLPRLSLKTSVYSPASSPITISSPLSTPIREPWSPLGSGSSTSSEWSCSGYETWTPASSSGDEEEERDESACDNEEDGADYFFDRYMIPGAKSHSITPAPAAKGGLFSSLPAASPSTLHAASPLPEVASKFATSSVLR